MPCRRGTLPDEAPPDGGSAVGGDVLGEVGGDGVAALEGVDAALAEELEVLEPELIADVLEERDVQVRGYTIRLPLDVLLVAVVAFFAAWFLPEHAVVALLFPVTRTETRRSARWALGVDLAAGRNFQASRPADSSAFMASGFSHMTCFPASSACFENE